MTDRVLRRNGLAPSGVHRAAPFIGRERELDWLTERLAAAGAGQPQVLLLVGDAGIGKTRLLREFESRAAQRGVVVCAGRGYDEFAVPFLPFLDAFGPRLRELPPALAAALGAQAEIVRSFANGGAGTVAAAPHGNGEDKLRLFLAVSRAVIELARQGPMLLVLDDLHWVDQASLELFAHLVFTVADSAGSDHVPLLIVGSTRPLEREQQLARTVARFQREAICHTLELGGLGESDVRQLVRGLGLERASQQLIAAVNDATNGNPLFVQEVVHHLARKGALAGAGVVDNAEQLLALPMPADVTGAIADRLGELGPRPRALLTLAACIGDPCSVATLRAVTETDPAEVLASLEEAAGQGLVSCDTVHVQFAHPLIRQVLYATLPTAVRQRHHATIAAALIRAPVGEVDIEIAHHLIAAGPLSDPAVLLRFAQQAGDRAFASAAWRDAARFYRAALTADESHHLLPARERAKLHSLAGQAYFRDQDADPCLEQFERAIAGFTACGDDRGLARALIGKTRAQLTLAAVAYGTLVDPAPLRAVAERIAEGHPALFAMLWSELAQVFWTARRPAEAEAAARRALATGERHGYDFVCAEALRALWLVQSQIMQVREAFASLEQARAHARRCGDTWLEGHVIQREPLTLTWLGRLDEAVARAAVADEFTRLTHDWGDHSLAQGALTCVAVARGDFTAAEHHARQALMMRHRSGYPWAGPTALPALAYAHLLRGRWGEAEAALALLAEPGEVFTEPGAMVLLGTYVFRMAVQAHADAGDAARAAVAERVRGMASAGSADDAVDVYALGVYCALIDIADLAGEAALAEGWARPLALAAEHGVVLSTGWVCLIARVLGVAATLRRDWATAEACFGRALEQAAAMRARSELARTQLDYARMLVARGRRGDRGPAADLLASAAAQFAELGMAPFLRAAQRLADQIAAPAPPATARLSVRETAVLARIARGATDVEVARELVLSASAVARARRAAMRKLGIATLADAAAAVVAAPPPPTAERPALQIIVFTDMQGSTELFQRLGDSEARAVVRAHDVIIRQCLQRCGGTELKHTGDGMMAAFTSASNAVDWAIAIQRALLEHNARTPERAIHVRIGINAGEPIAEDGQLFGTAVNAAARICAQARADQILVAEVIRTLAEGKGIEFVDRGWVGLRGLPQRFRLYEVPW